MTQEELEAGLTALREQIFHMQRQQEDAAKLWYRWGLATAVIGIAAVIGTMVGHNRPELQFIAMLCVVLTLAFHSAGRPPAHLPFWSQLTWAWPPQGIGAYLRSLGIWIVIVLILLGLFAIFQLRG